MPCIAYYKSRGYGWYNLWFARKIGSIWQVELVDWEVCHFQVYHNTVSLKFDNSDCPHIAYLGEWYVKYAVGPASIGIEEDDEDLLPSTFFLKQNYPNPFNLETTIRYALPEDRKVTLKVYNVLGREIKVLLDEFIHSGFHQVVWDGRDSSGRTVPCGVYFLKFDAGDYSVTKKLLKVR